jgi:hypothetical protein
MGTVARVAGALAALARSRWMWLLAGALVAVNAVVFPAAVARIGTTPDARPLDLRLSYSADEAYRAFAAMGEAGRHAYRVVETTVDVAYPVLYTVFLAALLAALLRRAWPGARASAWLAMVPFGVLVADLLENAGIVVLLGRFPGSLDGVAPVASAFTTAKWTMLGAVLALIAASLVAAIGTRVRGRRPPAAPVG